MSRKTVKNYLDIFGNNEDHFDNIINSSINAVTEISRFPKGSGKLGLAVGLFGTVVSLMSVSKTVIAAYSSWKESREYTITISHPDTAYDVVQNWISEIVDPQDVHELRGTALPFVPKEKREPSHKFVRFDFSQSMSVPVNLNGHHIVISAYVDEPSEDRSSDMAPARRRVSKGVRTITLSAKTVEGYEALGAELERRTRESMDSLESPPKVFMSDKWGDFTSRTQPPRPIESIILSKGVMEGITKHVETFLDSEKKYEEINMPYHTGILLYGPPGTGKTSIVKGLSSKFSMNIYHINLRAMEDDAQLFDEFSAIPPRSLILLEDIDVATPSAGDREDVNIESIGITPSGLLNVLDGTMSPYGSVIVMTTNDLDSMDPAITRAGRIDFEAKIDYMDNDQLIRICKFYLGRVPEGLPTIPEETSLSSAEVTGVFRTHINDLDNADTDLIALVSEKVSESLMRVDTDV